VVVWADVFFEEIAFSFVVEMGAEAIDCMSEGKGFHCLLDHKDIKYIYLFRLVSVQCRE